MSKATVRIIALYSNPESYSVIWSYKPRAAKAHRHAVTYDQQSKTFADDLQAAREFGECVRHAAECAGAFDRYTIED